MRPDEAKFIVNTMPSIATELLTASLRHGNDIWRDLMDAGLIKAIASRATDRRNLLESMIRFEDKQHAKAIIGAVLDSLKKPQREKLMTNERGGEVFLNAWLRHCIVYEHKGSSYSMKFDGANKDLDVLLSAFSERGISINPEFQAAGKRGGKFSTSVLRSVFEQCMKEIDSFDQYVAPAVEMMVRHGASLDAASRELVLTYITPARVDTLVTKLHERGLINLSEWVAEPCEKALPENVALIQAKMAKEMIEKTIGAHRASPGA